MKRINLKILTILFSTILFFGANQINAQYGRMNGPGGCRGAGIQCNIPNLTEAQQKKIDELRISHQKNMLQFRNQMDIKNAQLKALTSADKADMNTINKTIDEIGALRTQMMKESENHRQQVRAQLTDEQRVQFDLRKGNRGPGPNGKCGMGGMRGFKGQGKGNGPINN
jgi:Spy/CpxP family protein refolding chaperone